MNLPRTLGELKKSGYRARTVKQELRDNLIARIRSGLPLFADVHGYEDTVVPALQRAILAGHSINLLGLRGLAGQRRAQCRDGIEVGPGDEHHRAQRDGGEQEENFPA